jgi:hypothetical protein
MDPTLIVNEAHPAVRMCSVAGVAAAEQHVQQVLLDASSDRSASMATSDIYIIAMPGARPPLHHGFCHLP